MNTLYKLGQHTALEKLGISAELLSNIESRAARLGRSPMQTTKLIGRLLNSEAAANPNRLSFSKNLLSPPSMPPPAMRTLSAAQLQTMTQPEIYKALGFTPRSSMGTVSMRMPH